MVRLTFILSILILSLSYTSAQTLDDALRLSIHNYNSTARFAGVSGAFSPLGADVSVASINPAGIAEFRKSEITATLNSFNTKNSAELLDSQEGLINDLSESQIGLGNIAAVFHYDPPSFDTRTFNLAIGYNQIANYKETIEYGGTTSGTILQRFLEQAEGRTLNELGDFEAGLAYDAEAIFDPEEDGSYLSDFVTLSERVQKNEVIERTGSLNEVFISIGSNIKNKLSWGATLGFPFASYSETKRYTESDPNNNVDFFDEIGFNQNLKTSGVGFNLKLGVIYKVTPRLRVGAAIHSQSYFLLTDEFDTDIAYTFTEDGNTQSSTAQSPISEFEYQISGPWRALAGLGYLYSFGDLKGFVSGEVEYVKYNSASFNLTANSTDPLDQFFEDDLNEDVDNFFGSAVNIRAGTELAYKMLRARLGVALPSSPFSDNSIIEVSPSYSVGLGYRANRYYVDVAYTLRSFGTNYSPYRLLDRDPEPFIDIDNNRTIMTVTLGYKL